VERFRAPLEADEFAAHFCAAKLRVADMDVRFIGLKDPIERSVFAIYAASPDTFAVERPGALTEKVRSTLRVYVTALLERLQMSGGRPLHMVDRLRDREETQNPSGFRLAAVRRLARSGTDRGRMLAPWDLVRLALVRWHSPS
jgi:hypothetical protein